MFFARNFKNFASAELDFDQPVTLLVGPNGSGKSNLIEAVELLAFLASGRPLHEVTDLGRGGGLEIRGGLDACAKRGEDRFTLGFEGKVGEGDSAVGVCYEITVRIGKAPRVVGERLAVKGSRAAVFQVLPDETDSASTPNAVRFNHHAPNGRKPVPTVAADRSALSQYARFAHDDQQLGRTLAVIDALTAILEAPAVFDPEPKLMREYQPISTHRLARNGYNVSSVLADLQLTRKVRADAVGKGFVKDKSGPETKVLERILQRIARLPDEAFQDFNFIVSNNGDALLGFRVPDHDKPVTARVLSDGTLRALAILTALETSAKGTRLILEEFDNGVHPSRVHLLAEALFDCSERNGLRALATTHNPATLDALTPEQTQSVLFVVPAENGDGARLLPLPKLPGLIDFITAGRLGDLITRRVYERHLVPNYEEERVERIHAWLDALP